MLCAIIGMLFRKDAGQHILKNPLVINGIIEKVPNLVIDFYNNQPQVPPSTCSVILGS